MATDISIVTDAPADPATVTEYGDALPELVRALNHVTRHHEALADPPDADRLVRNIALAASRLPQLLDQVSSWLGTEYAAGRIRMTDGSPPMLAAMTVQTRLTMASEAAARLGEALEQAASVTSEMAAAGDDSGEEGTGG